jgi:hypothetical protein
MFAARSDCAQRVARVRCQQGFAVSKTRTSRLVWAGVLLLGCAGTTLLADDWPSPQVREVFSAARNYFVRVTPGTSWGDVFGFAGAPRGPYARAEFYQRRDDGAYAPVVNVALANPVAPVDFFVTDRGFLAALDNWHNRGYGKVFALYSPSGALIQSYDLADLFSKEEIERFEHSASSILWHQGPSYLQADQRSLYVSVDEKGGGLSFNTETGAYRYCEWQGQSFTCRRSNTNRTWRPFNSNG